MTDYIEELKKIPCNFPSQVREHANKTADYCSWTQWCQYLETDGEELIIRRFAFTREKKSNNLLLTEVERLMVGKEYAVRKNCYQTTMSGYRVVYKAKTVKASGYYGYCYNHFEAADFDVWFSEKQMPEYGTIVNLEDLLKVPKYKYCGYSGCQPLKEYLEYYNEDPAVEFFGKLGIRYTKQIGGAVKKDKQFRRFVVDHKDSFNLYGYRITKLAYEKHLSFEEAEDLQALKNHATQVFKNLNKPNYDVDRLKIAEYYDRLNYRERVLFRDYWNACVALGLDMRDTKNAMPKKLVEMHDVRTAEYAAHKAKINAEKKKKFNEELKAVAAKNFIEVASDKFTMLLPESLKDFEKESEALKHCVAKMGYDQKMHDGKILIGFIRLKKDPDTPYFTTEYDLTKKGIVQIHGLKNCSAPEDVKDFVDAWANLLKKRKGVTA